MKHKLKDKPNKSLYIYKNTKNNCSTNDLSNYNSYFLHFSKSSRGITLIALIITIIIMMILVGITIKIVINEGILKSANLASFATEMQKIKENVEVKKTELYAKEIMEGSPQQLFTEKLNKDQIEILDTLKKEILYIRDGMKEGKSPEEYNVEEFDNLINEEGNVEGIYIIDKQTGDGKENTYIYDEKTDTVYKIPATKIGKKVYHSYECAMQGKGGTEEGKKEGVIDKESEIVQVGDEYYYAPNMKGFSNTQTYMEYYSEDYKEIKDVPVKEYIEKGEQYEITEGGTKYTLHNYGAKIWANVKTNGFTQEAWWVWIPRYAYKINDSDKKMEIIYVDVENKPANPKYNGELPEGYEVHPAFTEGGNELRGIWVSKYEASYGAPKNEESAPDMTGFDTEHTYIELYDIKSKSFEEVKLSEANLNTINENNKWYDYNNKIWANIKTVNNGQEAWWVWIPRYAYNIRSENNIDIIFIDTNNKPISSEYNGNLPGDYEVHPAFNPGGKKLKGIWVSKYEASFVQSTTNNDNVLAPNMEGFNDKENTYIELYDAKTGKFNEEVKLSKADLSTINKDKKWYDYSNKIWANIKTNANGEEAWWVWVPRYAYKIIGGTDKHTIDIIFIDKENKPIDKKYGAELPKGFEVHPAFTTKDGKQLEGIWMSKYEASNSAN